MVSVSMTLKNTPVYPCVTTPNLIVVGQIVPASVGDTGPDP